MEGENRGSPLAYLLLVFAAGPRSHPKSLYQSLFWDFSTIPLPYTTRYTVFNKPEQYYSTQPTNHPWMLRSGQPFDGRWQRNPLQDVQGANSETGHTTEPVFFVPRRGTRADVENGHLRRSAQGTSASWSLAAGLLGGNDRSCRGQEKSPAQLRGIDNKGKGTANRGKGTGGAAAHQGD